jgi:hypothetical protein
MLACTRPASIGIAVMLGMALNVHLVIPAFSDPRSFQSRSQR